MKLLVKRNVPVVEEKSYTPIKSQRDPIKQELRRRIYETIEVAAELAAGDREDEIRFRLFAIQNYCKTVEKTFIVVEQSITCDQFNLGGSFAETATLFRGPNEDASVAICVTRKGSILHRNGGSWEVYKNEGDVDPLPNFNALKLPIAR